MPAPQASNQAVLIERIETLRVDISELKQLMMTHIEAQEQDQRQYLREHAKVEASTVAAHRRLDDLEKLTAGLVNDTKALKDAIQPLIFANKILTWVGVLLGGSVVALIWSIITGQVTLVFQ